MNEKHDWRIDTFTDEDLISLRDAISQERDKRKGKRVKIAFEAFKEAAMNLDKLLDTNYYNFEGEGYTMYGVICSISDAIKEEGYPL